MKLLDKYVLKQVIAVFIMGVLVFTSIIFALINLYYMLYHILSFISNLLLFFAKSFIVYYFIKRLISYFKGGR